METTRIVRCPSCGKSARYDLTNAHRPFCSSRCQTLDTAHWADEKFKIPTSEICLESDSNDLKHEDDEK